MNKSGFKTQLGPILGHFGVDVETQEVKKDPKGRAKMSQDEETERR